MSIPEPLLKLDSYYFLLFVIPGFITVWTYQKAFRRQIKSDFEYLGLSLFCGLVLFLMLLFLPKNIGFFSYVFGAYFPISLVPAAVVLSIIGASFVLVIFLGMKLADLMWKNRDKIAPIFKKIKFILNKKIF
jgi:hypothetical protein